MLVMHQATFGNKAGSHQLISTTLPIANATLDQLRFMVDRPAGHIDSSIVWAPYWGCQPVNNMWAIWRGEEDRDAPRKNMVKVRVVLLAIEDCRQCNISEVLKAFDCCADAKAESTGYLTTLIERLTSSPSPIAIPGIDRVPSLLLALWPRLWPAARAAFSVRTVFAPESINSSLEPMIIVFPEENSVRWRSFGLVNAQAESSDFISRWVSATLPNQIERVLQINLESLPASLSVLTQLERICLKLEKLHSNQGTLVDALTLVRTMEALPDRFELPQEDTLSVCSKLISIADGSVGDVRMASLCQLSLSEDLKQIERSLANWIENHLLHVSEQDAIWIIRQHVSPDHAAWWKRGVQRGLENAVKSRRSEWARAFWRWCIRDADLMQLLSSYVDGSDLTQEWILMDVPALDDGELFQKLCDFCRIRDWALLLAKALGCSRPLLASIKILRATVEHAEKGVKLMLVNRTDSEIVDTATTMNWTPLISAAAELVSKNSTLLEVNIGSTGHLPLVATFLRVGGIFPQVLLRSDFLVAILDGLVAGEPLATEIASYLGASTGPHLLDHPSVNKLMGRLGSEVVDGAVDEWFRRLAHRADVTPPPDSLSTRILAAAPTKLQGGSIRLILRLVDLLPSFSEVTFGQGLTDFGFQWDVGDHQLVASKLVDRQWTMATHSFRRSWKRELILVAYYARELLTWSNGFLFPPNGISDGYKSKSQLSEGDKMTIDVGIITMKEEEYSALLDKFDQTTRHPGKNRDYDVASIRTEKGECRVAITRCVQQGNGFAQTAASELISDLHPRFIVVVGIAGGVPNEDFCLGDVIVSDYIQDLTQEDTGTQCGEQKYNAFGGPLHSEASRIVESLRSIEKFTTSSNSLLWNSNDVIGVARPSLEGKFTTTDSEWNDAITKALAKHVERNRLFATAKCVASSDRLIKDPELLQNWRRVLKSVAAVEMESAGVYLLCQRHPLPFLAIRGISDIVGWKRNEAWTLYACHTAAAYTKMLVEAGVFCVRQNE